MGIDNIVAGYDFTGLASGDPAPDASGNGRTLTYYSVGGAYCQTLGNISGHVDNVNCGYYSCALSGSYGNFHITQANLGFDFATNSFSVAGWIAGHNQYRQHSYFQNGAWNVWTHRLYTSARDLVFWTVGLTGGTHALTASTVLPSGVSADWFHMGISYDYNTKEKKIYLDGVNVATATATHSAQLASISGDFYWLFGDSHTGANTPSYTKLDTGFITSDVVTQGDIDLAYNGGLGLGYTDLAGGANDDGWWICL